MTTPAPPSLPGSRTKQVIGNSSYRRLWGIGAVNQGMRWLEAVAIAAFVLNLTDSPFQVALVFFFRMIPMFALGALIGAVSDRINRKQLLTVSFALLALVYFGLALSVVTNSIEVWHVFVGSLLAGMVSATDFTVRRAMVADVVRREHLSTALGLDMATSNFTRVPGPFLAGVLLTTIGVEAVYFIGGGLFLMASFLALTLTYTPPEKSADMVNPLRNIAEGVRYIRKDSIILAVLVITVIMNMFAFPYQSMVPVIARDSLEVNELLLGIMVSVEGLGATLGALWVASRATSPQYTRIFFWGSVLFLLMILSLSRVPWYGVALPILFLGGFGMAGFGTMQSIIVVAAAPPAVRGRVLGVLAVTIGTGPIAALYVGAIAQAAGAPMAVMIIAVAGLALMTITAIAIPAFLKQREVQPLSERTAAAEGSPKAAASG